MIVLGEVCANVNVVLESFSYPSRNDFTVWNDGDSVEFDMTSVISC